MLLLPAAAAAVEGISRGFVFYRPATGATGAQPDSAFLELAWQLHPLSLRYQESNGMLSSELLVQTALSGPGDFFLQDVFIAATTPFQRGGATAPPVYFRQRYRLPDSGTYFYTLRISLKNHPDQFVSFTDSVRVRLADTPRFSDLMILDTVYQPASDNPYVKAGMERVARPLAFVDTHQLDLKYYAELYHAPATGGILQVSITKNGKGNPLPGMLHTDTLQKAPALYAVAGNFDLHSLPSGNYQLNTGLYDTTGRPIALNRLFFQLSNPYPTGTEAGGWDTAAMSTPLKFLDISKTFVAKYSDEERREILKMLRPAADEVETANIGVMLQKGSDPLHTAYFIYNFFVKRNADKPETAWKEYANKVREVNKLFSESGRMGYETDRGVVYLKYGPPDERVRAPSEAGARPYEVWRYDYNPRIPQQSSFLFYQEGMTIGEYRLLHSTVPGETYNPRWGEILYRGDSERLKNSRAWRLMNNE